MSSNWMESGLLGLQGTAGLEAKDTVRTRWWGLHRLCLQVSCSGPVLPGPVRERGSWGAVRPLEPSTGSAHVPAPSSGRKDISAADPPSTLLMGAHAHMFWPPGPALGVS